MSEPDNKGEHGQGGGGRWTSEELHLYQQGLEIYGRDYRAVAQHIGTRTPVQVRVKTTNYFIRLLAEGKSLPEKVRQTGKGIGWTLSGRPLDLDGYAARAHLTPEMRLRLSKLHRPLEFFASSLMKKSPDDGGEDSATIVIATALGHTPLPGPTGRPTLHPTRFPVSDYLTPGDLPQTPEFKALSEDEGLALDEVLRSPQLTTTAPGLPPTRPEPAREDEDEDEDAERRLHPRHPIQAPRPCLGSMEHGWALAFPESSSDENEGGNGKDDESEASSSSTTTVENPLHRTCPVSATSLGPLEAIRRPTGRGTADPPRRSVPALPPPATTIRSAIPVQAAHSAAPIGSPATTASVQAAAHPGAPIGSPATPASPRLGPSRRPSRGTHWLTSHPPATIICPSHGTANPRSCCPNGPLERPSSPGLPVTATALGSSGTGPWPHRTRIIIIPAASHRSHHRRTHIIIPAATHFKSTYTRIITIIPHHHSRASIRPSAACPHIGIIGIILWARDQSAIRAPISHTRGCPIPTAGFSGPDITARQQHCRIIDQHEDPHVTHPRILDQHDIQRQHHHIVANAQHISLIDHPDDSHGIGHDHHHHHHHRNIIERQDDSCHDDQDHESFR
ncbi:hypothetical protein PAPYR_8149 [Paratrimastix pyriformis]|uniref:Myb-like domain-containing protein n=1 Tax=Paratrimastix pyriformis TaxID=342808 RepID=A0ABQ8UBA7_9EUKA|nr:hypothetical protein PAPYR_8149 [Paratrimastix pyriformis]